MDIEERQQGSRLMARWMPVALWAPVRKENPTLYIIMIVLGTVATTYKTHFNYISQTYIM